jgi:hypothetical protein
MLSLSSSSDTSVEWEDHNTADSEDEIRLRVGTVFTKDGWSHPDGTSDRTEKARREKKNVAAGSAGGKRISWVGVAGGAEKSKEGTPEGGRKRRAGGKSGEKRDRRSGGGKRSGSDAL